MQKNSGEQLNRAEFNRNDVKEKYTSITHG